ncbi:MULTISPECIES: sugar ABC transporter substrate-binding protein [unclassified Mesorhizobium]|uniref:sugar ABC transporter substrate-binding protein n=1 Tax=unclassified Mesorhizobium TaxID=325217 RepID=UPI002415849A|nr:MULTISPECIES: sugar ABC transporter substrate-binding protein [unclassified Mesorhizobium]MDG4889888.1 sugar ABC transporter substrate-binding protein [Mesorhizobium sp. WSM4887]MDG4904031.1 sugar ABC transporter substrate-binding protein [Mesorhizobium sp. WSM4962]MDG4909058.1 sugar ABC transporter substrate-binding protein [Mesorhizobium sp. WSM4898]MDG4921682.1 sugar ABC transporter substrate-binding protein [Mesorhizobium sp. WSM4989]
MLNAIALSATLSCSFVLGSSEVLADYKPPILGVVAIDLQNSFFVDMKKAGDVAEKDYKVKAIWQSAEGSLEKEVSLVENFIAQKVDVILVDPLDKNALMPVINKATDAGIPVITMGNKVEGKANYSTIYPDAQTWPTVARALAQSIDGEGKIALLIGARGSWTSDNREKAFTETIKNEFPKIQIVGIQPTNWDAAKSADAVQSWLAANPDLKAIVCLSDYLCYPAQSIADAAGAKLKYAGWDGDSGMADSLNSGATVIDGLTGAPRVGYWNIALAARIARGEKFDRTLYLPVKYITSKQTADTLAAKGLKFDYITPDKAAEELGQYSQQLGPNAPASAMSSH